jgi:predicted DNA-binding transcriptional regulator AlpA
MPKTAPKPAKQLPPPTGQIWINVREAAAMCGVGVTQLMKWRQLDADFPPPRKIGKSARWLRKDIERWAESRPAISTYRLRDVAG